MHLSYIKHGKNPTVSTWISTGYSSSLTQYQKHAVG
uniref:Uncharacterized protein n=1 Tax=Anguilla anguilla TaxID=7936 RepID=A0A0E9PET3_ANGAN